MPLEIKWFNGIAYLHGTVAGKRIRRSAKTRDPELAEICRAETEARLVKASHYGAEKETTYDQAAYLYLKAGNPDRYLTPIIKAFRGRTIATIFPGHIRDLADKLYPDAKNSTKNRSVVKPARAVINWAADRGLCKPLTVQGFEEADVFRDAGDRAWIDQFRAHAPNEWLRVLPLFMFVTAARVGECMAMIPEDLDLDNKRAFAGVTKNGHPRIYYLTDELVRELRILKPRAVNYGRGELRVFGYSDHHGIRVPWKETCERAGIAHLTPHEAGRHGFATEMIQRKKVDHITAAKLGNWKDSSVMLKRYVKAGNLPQVAEAVFGDDAAQNGNRLTKSPVARFQVIGKKKKSG